MANESKKPVCKLIGRDGNVFAIIGNVQRALRKAGLNSRADEFGKRAMSSGSYDEVLMLCHEYVSVR
jgi:hypothetical protein